MKSGKQQGLVKMMNSPWRLSVESPCSDMCSSFWSTLTTKPFISDLCSKNPNLLMNHCLLSSKTSWTLCFKTFDVSFSHFSCCYNIESFVIFATDFCGKIKFRCLIFNPTFQPVKLRYLAWINSKWKSINQNPTITPFSSLCTFSENKFNFCFIWFRLLAVCYCWLSDKDKLNHYMTRMGSKKTLKEIC